MASTEQRSGFRLPWASDAPPGSSEKDQTLPAADATPDPDDATTPRTAAEATEMQEIRLPDRRPMSWPDAEGTVGRAHEASDSWETEATEATGPTVEVAPVPATPERPRRENLLVTGLVRAMRDAAASARTETAARFADEAKARVEAIQADAAEGTTALRAQADAEIVEIRDWSKAEMARIREETDKRISNRKQHLESEIEGHGARVEHRIAGVQAAVAEFERSMEVFFEGLMAEEDPARLAGLAESLPEPPSLDLADLDQPLASSALSFPMDVLDSRGAAAAEAEALASLDASAEGEDDTTSTHDDGSVEEIAEEDVARRLEAFTTHAPGAAEPVTTQLAVVGLVSVASIAGFKRAIARTHGVRAVSVASGPSGDFVFSVTHDPEADLRSTVPLLDGFQAVITDDAEGVLTITATDPESAN